mgnify:CR=1 FL=1
MGILWTVLAVSAFARTTWVPDPSGGAAPELDGTKVRYGAVKAWSPDGRHQYFRKSHYPVANVLLTNCGEADGLTTMKAFVTFLDAPGGAKDFGERGSVRQFLYRGRPVQGVISLEYIQNSTRHSARPRPRRDAMRSDSVRRRTTSARRRT